ncbi:MAG: hypothetical protein M1347_07695 [Chloroflexi bacterium]|nr:hypothetical protein [Chloroflexota bacterium]
MDSEQQGFTIEYVYTPSADAEERSARAYDLILDLVLSAIQCPEEDAVGAFPNVADAGAKLGSSQAEAVPAKC